MNGVVLDANVALDWFLESSGLDAPDVPYFHLAREMAVPIATRDKAVIAACRAWNVEHWMSQVTAGKETA